MRMFFVVLLIAKNYENHLHDRWRMDKMCHVHTIEHYTGNK